MVVIWSLRCCSLSSSSVAPSRFPGSLYALGALIFFSDAARVTCALVSRSWRRGTAHLVSGAVRTAKAGVAYADDGDAQRYYVRPHSEPQLKVVSFSQF